MQAKGKEVGHPNHCKSQLGREWGRRMLSHLAEVIWHSSVYQAGPCYEQEEGVNKKAVRGQFTAKRTSGEIISLPFWLGKTPFPLHLTNQQFDILRPNSKISNREAPTAASYGILVLFAGKQGRKTGGDRRGHACSFLPRLTWTESNTPDVPISHPQILPL